MEVSTSFTVLTVSLCIAAYMYYGIVRVPQDMEKRDDVMWIYAKRKYTRALSITGEYLGLGNRVVLSRTVSPLLSSSSPFNSTKVKISDSHWGGVRVRLYEPKGQVSNGPAMIWIHGGGWVTRTVESDDRLAAELAQRLDILVVSVDYRLAPEHPYPAAFDDCLAVTQHLMEHAKEFKVNPKRVVIAGASAGGNLAAAVALKLRDIGAPYQVEHQVLIVPCLQALDFLTPSYQANGNNAYLPTNWMVHYWMLYGIGIQGDKHLVSFAETNDHTSIDLKLSKYAKYVDHNLINQKLVSQSYIPGKKDHGDDTVWKSLEKVFLDPYFAPLMSHDLSSLPPAYVITAQYDILRDDGLMYAKRLLQAGSHAVIKNYDRTYHAVIDHYSTISVSKLAMDELVEYLAKNL